MRQTKTQIAETQEKVPDFPSNLKFSDELVI